MQTRGISRKNDSEKVDLLWHDSHLTIPL